MPEDDPKTELVDAEPSEVDGELAALPVVARLVVEIRSDGSRTVARGAMEDAISGEKVSIDVRGTTPLSLALGLAKSMASGRAFARSTMRALLPRRGKKR